MGNKAKPLIPIELDKKRNFLYDLNAMISFEEITGKNTLQGINPADLSAKDFRALVWACLIHEDKELTLEQVGAMFHSRNMDEMANRLSAALEAAIPEGDKDAPLAGKPPPG